MKSLSHVQLFATLWTVAYQTPPSMGFSRQEYWSGLPFPPPGNLPDPRIKLGSPALQVNSLPSEPPGNPWWIFRRVKQKHLNVLGFIGGASGKNSDYQFRRLKRCWFNPWVRKIPWRRKLQPTTVFLPGESHGQWGLVNYRP